jgi:hypothetical protein
MPLAEDQHLIEALAARRPHLPLRERVRQPPARATTHYPPRRAPARRERLTG